MADAKIAAGTCGVYRIAGPNGRSYVGQSVRIRDRLYRHKQLLNAGSHPNRHLQRAWQAYGSDAFTGEVLAEVPPDKDLLALCEQEFMDFYRLRGGVYNAAPAAGSTAGYKHSEDFRRKRREHMLRSNPNDDPEVRAKKTATLKGRRPSPSNTAAIRAALTGKPRSIEFRDACSRGQSGRVHSEESKRKRSEKLKGRVISEETRLKMSLAAKAQVAKRARKDAVTGRFIKRRQPDGD